MTLGVVLGTISSIFIASPIAYLLLGKRASREAKKQAAQA